MMRIKLPSFKKHYGLLISDAEVLMVSWKRGSFERIALFSNDEGGIKRFSDFLAKNISTYKNTGFQVLANIIGEDYRVEKVAHLLGKYKLDFHNRRMEQLFRGSRLRMSIVQGREDRGRREDIVLFYGLLTENKILPWMNVISKTGEIYLAGVHGVSFANTPLLQAVAPDWQKGNHLLMTIHEKGLLRQTQYVKGNIRFSRVSKINDENPEAVALSVKKELERTIQYLNSLKISVASGISIQFVCPGNIVGQLREMVVGAEKIRFYFHDASTVARQLGLSKPAGELGRDSSLSLHSVFSNLWLNQLADLVHIRFYWFRIFSQVATLALVAYGLVGVFSPAGNFYSGYELSREVGNLLEKRDQKKNQYENELQLSDDPPSDPQNVSAVSRVFRLLDNIHITPTSLLYYVANGLEKNKRLQVGNIRWYVSNNPDASGGDIQSLLSGEDIFQTLELDGRLDPIANETYVDVANRAQQLLDSFEKRSDISIRAVELPRQELGIGDLQGTLTEDYNVEAARNRNFKLRIIWKAYDKNRIEGFLTKT